MRLIKAFIAGVTGLFIIITLFSLLIPSRVRVSRAVLINNTSLQEVVNEIAVFENWKNWHPVFTADSATMYLATFANAGKDSGYHILRRGKQAIIQRVAADSASVKFLMRSQGENDIDNDIVITPIAARHAVQVEWRSITRLHWYPWEKLVGIFIDKITGPGYEAALNGLKAYVEKRPL